MIKMLWEKTVQTVKDGIVMYAPYLLEQMCESIKYNQNIKKAVQKVWDAQGLNNQLLSDSRKKKTTKRGWTIEFDILNVKPHFFLSHGD